MESECKPSKFRYDIAMSKRTRKPSNIKKEAAAINVQESCDSAEESSEKVVDAEKDMNKENDNKKSLKQLIGGRSLNQHFTEEENQLQLIVKQQDDGLNRVKFKEMVSRYARVLSHLIKLKRKPEMAFGKKPVLPFTK